MRKLRKRKGGGRDKRGRAVYSKKNMEGESPEHPFLSLQDLPHSPEENRLLLHRGNHGLYLQPQIYRGRVYPPERGV